MSLGETDDPAVQYILDKWGLVGDSIIIEGMVSEIYVAYDLKRGAYNSDSIRGHLKIHPDNLKCDFAIKHPQAEIVEASGDMGVVGQVVRRAFAELGLQMRLVLGDHFEAVHNVQKESPKTVKIDAGIPREETVEI